MDSKNVRNVEIDPHSSEDAISLRYDVEEEGGKVLRKSKIIQLQNFSDQLNPSTLAKTIVDQCALIGQNRLQDVEQVIFYLQRRVATKHELFKANGNADLINQNAQVVQLEEYIEMLYEDGEKLKASALILSLCMKASNLKVLADNDVLIGALTRVFREDSRKHFELGTNLASIFFQLSLFTKFHLLLSHYKIGALSLQLLENELKRYDLWQEQWRNATDQRRKWELAIRKQEIFMVECLKILANLAVETKTEIKMVKRGLLNSLIKCLEHSRSPLLLKTTILFLWKLSVYTENKEAMEKLKVLERVVELFANADQELANISFALLFNLSFDPGMRSQMVACGLINHVVPHISNNEVALGLLYQLSIVDDAKAIFTFTDSISTLMQLLRSPKTIDQLPIKGTLMNLALEKRNAQLICGADGKGLDAILEMAFRQKDPMLMKLARNLATHEGSIQQHFEKYIPQLLDSVRLSLKQVPIPTHAIECMAILAQLHSLQWEHVKEREELIQLLSQILRDHNEKAATHFGDELLIQSVAACGMVAGSGTGVARKVLPMSGDLIRLLNHKQEDDEFVLQIAFCFARLIANPDLINVVCKEHKQILEYLINMTHDKNQQLSTICDQALQLVSEIDSHWFKRIAEERFCWHNAQWLDIVEGQGAQDSVLLGAEDGEDGDDESFLSEQFRTAVFGVDEILGSAELSE